MKSEESLQLLRRWTFTRLAPTSTWDAGADGRATRLSMTGRRGRVELALLLLCFG